MNLDQLEGKFKENKGKLKQKYAEHISDDDLQYSEGKFEEMLGKLQAKTGKTKEELEKEINNF
ncbi:CsbD family protein [Psychroflexus montanilacus]|uniref:CsbD family protein n=1 Tax=Psychroflexus montanilacus TaxID=2873598 RepID=UPI001CCE29F3|nr:CsbD family protein [Psychroflexus montanilacus]MBZ9651224.1 CsbD family protein [Psychroflexus montanilacus]